MSLVGLYCAVDDFWQAYEPTWRQQQLTQRLRAEGIELITRLKAKIKNQVMSLTDKPLL